MAGFVLVVPHSGARGVTICAECDRPCSDRIFVDGQPWATACRRHRNLLTAAAHRHAGLPAPPTRAHPRKGKKLLRATA